MSLRGSSKSVTRGPVDVGGENLSTAPAQRSQGTRIFWQCMFCRGRCAESRMTCTFCGRIRREAA